MENFNVRQKKVVKATEPKILCLAAAASGKAIPNMTPIPTPNGWKFVKDIKEGDYLFDRYGQATKVLGVYPQGKLEVYEITFADGRKARCSKDHIWSVYRNKDSFRLEEYTVEQLLKDGLIDEHNRYKFSIPCATGVSYNEKKYNTSPYVAGVFLCNKASQIDNKKGIFVLNNMNFKILKRVADLIGANDFYDNNGFWEFKKDGKFITTNQLFNSTYCNEYKYGSEEQRLEFIRGIMDTSGYIIDNFVNNTCSIFIKHNDANVIYNIKETLGSLGYVSHIEESSNSEQYNLIINISIDDRYKLFWLEEKRNNSIISYKNYSETRDFTRTEIISIKSLNYEEEMTCFYVDNDEHLFLMNDFICTHNTKVLTGRIKNLVENEGVPANKIVAITFTRLAAEEMRKRLGKSADGMFIGTIHSYANKICNENGLKWSLHTVMYVENY